MRKNEIWVVTGASGGIGRVLVRQLLAKGCSVAALTRKPAVVAEQQGAQEKLLVVETNICEESSVQAALAAVVERFGRYDVVVNTAGYALRGAIEEITDEEARAAFNVNLFGMLNVCRNFVPGLREQGGGFVINFAGIESVVATPYSAVYNATKFATDALTDALNKEAGQFGIAAICVKTGPMRTEYISHKQDAALKLDAYDDVRAAAAEAEAALEGNETVDPEKLAALLIRLTEEENPPKNLYLAKKSVDTIREKWSFLENEFETWKWATVWVDFPKEECYYGKRS